MTYLTIYLIGIIVWWVLNKIFGSRNPGDPTDFVLAIFWPGVVALWILVIIFICPDLIRHRRE